MIGRVGHHPAREVTRYVSLLSRGGAMQGRPELPAMGTSVPKMPVKGHRASKHWRCKERGGSRFG